MDYLIDIIDGSIKLYSIYSHTARLLTH